MRLKYQMRGLGIGMTLVALLWAFSPNPSEGLSDSEIISRAKELGMIESGSRVLSELTEPETQPVEETMENPEEEPVEETMENSEEEPVKETTEELEEEPEELSEKVVEEEQETLPEEESPEEESPEEEVVTITVKSGSGSESVSRSLADAGLVADAKAYDKFLCDNNYSKSIRVGTFQIQMGSTEEEIAKIITGKQ
ncbi:MAG: hypothetical protein K6G30_11330 [Acetatifactor sp.]|nr:hypothetical protein [Acetatifactor sp.]